MWGSRVMRSSVSPAAVTLTQLPAPEVADTNVESRHSLWPTRLGENHRLPPLAPEVGVESGEAPSLLDPVFPNDAQTKDRDTTGQDQPMGQCQGMAVERGYG